MVEEADTATIRRRINLSEVEWRHLELNKVSGESCAFVVCTKPAGLLRECTNELRLIGVVVEENRSSSHCQSQSILVAEQCLVIQKGKISVSFWCLFHFYGDDVGASRLDSG